MAAAKAQARALLQLGGAAASPPGSPACAAAEDAALLLPAPGSPLPPPPRSIGGYGTDPGALPAGVVDPAMEAMLARVSQLRASDLKREHGALLSRTYGQLQAP